MAAPTRTLVGTAPKITPPRAPSPASFMTVPAASRSVPVAGISKQAAVSALVSHARAVHGMPVRSLIKPKPKPRSLIQQVTDLVLGLPQGIIGLGVNAVTDTLAPARVLADVIGGHGLRSISDYLPATTGLVQSVGHTLGRVTHPGDYLKAIREGRILDVAAEDIGNLAIVGGAASKLLGTAGVTVGEAGAATGEVVGTAGELRAAGQPTIHAVGAMPAEGFGPVATVPAPSMGPALEVAEPGSVADLGRMAPPEPTARGVVRPRGLAGYVAKSGNVDTALAIERAGRAIGKVSSLGTEAASLPARVYTYPLEVAGKAMGLEGSPLRYAAQRLEQYATEKGPDSRLYRFTKLGREESHNLRSLRAASERSGVDAKRWAAQLARVVQSTGLDPEHAKAALLAVDNPGFFSSVANRNLRPEAVGRLLDIAYEGVPEGLRPTAATAQALWDYKAGNLDEPTRAAMDQVSQTAERISRQRTARRFAEGSLAPEQLEPMLRASSITKHQQRYSGIVARVQRQIDREYPGADRAVRLAEWTDAIMEDLPEAPRAREQYQAGAAGERDKAARRAYVQAQDNLARAVDDYVNLTEHGADQATVSAAQRNVDRLLERQHQIRDLVEQRVRRYDAAVGLSRASGEFAPGARRVVDEQGNVVDVATNRVQPQAGTEGVATGAQIRTEAANLSEQVAQDIRDGIERMTHGERPTFPRREGKVGGEHDFWDKVPTRVKKRLISEGWFKAAGEGIDLGELGDYMGMNPDQAAMRYIAEIQSMWDAQKGKGEHMVTAVADRMGISVDQAHAAIVGKISDYKGLLASEPVKIMDELRSDYEAMTPEERSVLDDAIRQYKADGEANPESWSALLEAYLGADAREIANVLGARGIDMEQLVEWVQTGDVVTSERAGLTPRSAAQYEQLGKFAEQVRSARALETENAGQLRVSIADVAREARDATRAERQAGRAVETAAEREKAARPMQGPQMPMSTNRIYERAPNAKMSPAERARYVQGQRRAQASAAIRSMQRLERARARALDKLSSVETELSRKYQDRLHEDLNMPAMTSFINAVTKGGERLGGLGGDARNPYLTGLVGRLASRYGISDGVIERLVEARLAKIRQTLYPDDGFTPGAGDEPMPSEADVVHSAFTDALASAQLDMQGYEWSNLRDSVAMENLTGEMRKMVTSLAGGSLRLNAPMRLIELVRSSEWNMPSDIRSLFEQRVDNYMRRRGNTLRRTFDDYAEAMPARFRTDHMTARRQIRALLEDSERLNKQHAGSGDVYLEMAEEQASTMDDFLANGISPTHLIGGGEAGITASGGGSYGGFGKKPLRAEHLRRTGLRPLAVEAYARLEADQAFRLVTNRLNDYIMRPVELGGFGRRADQVDGVATAISDWMAQHNGDPMAPVDIAKVADGKGWVPARRGDPVNRDTMLIPKRIREELSSDSLKWLTDRTAYKALRRGNQMWKMWVLPFSPKWLTGNVIGNMIQATVHAGIGPIELAKRMRDVVRAEGGGMAGIRALWDQEGVPDWAPNEIANHGLSFSEWRLMNDYMDEHAPRTRVGQVVARVAGASYKLNEFVDNMHRSAVYLSKLGDGVPREAALTATLNALGDFTRLSPIERNIVREILPFFAWLRHQTEATLRLPINSPGRAAILFKLSAMYRDPQAGDLADVIGSKIPLGGNLFMDFGTISPLASVNESSPFLDFDPRTLGQSVSPFLKFGIAALTGIDLNTMDQLKRPAGTFARGPFGQERATPPLLSILGGNIRHGLGELGYIATQQAPAPIRSLRDLALYGLEGPKARYATGYAVGNLTNPNQTIPRILLRGLNLPSPYTIDVSGAAARRQQQIERQRG